MAKQFSLNFIRTLRTWLNTNKIFFETVVAVLLSIMAIFVSIGSYEIAQKQTTLMEKEHLPFFSMRIDPICPQYYTEDAYCPDDRLTITNLGDQITQFIVDPRVFLIAENKNLDSVYIPIDYYYIVYTLPSNDTIKSWNSEDNFGSFGRFKELSKNFSQYAVSKGYDVKLEIKRYLILQYFDSWGDMRRDYYYVDTHRFRPLSENEIFEIDENYKISYPSNRYPLYFRENYSNETYDDWLNALAKKSSFLI